MSCKMKKNTWGPNPHCSSHISKMITSVDFGILCHLLRFMGIYQVPPLRVFGNAHSLFSFLPFLFVFLSFLFFIFFFSLSLGGPFSSGAPGHCPPMPPSRYATGPFLVMNLQLILLPCKNLLQSGGVLQNKFENTEQQGRLPIFTHANISLGYQEKLVFHLPVIRLHLQNAK